MKLPIIISFVAIASLFQGVQQVDCFLESIMSMPMGLLGGLMGGGGGKQQQQAPPPPPPPQQQQSSGLSAAQMQQILQQLQQQQQQQRPPPPPPPQQQYQQQHPQQQQQQQQNGQLRQFLAQCQQILPPEYVTALQNQQQELLGQGFTEGQIIEHQGKIVREYLQQSQAQQGGNNGGR